MRQEKLAQPMLSPREIGARAEALVEHGLQDLG